VKVTPEGVEAVFPECRVARDPVLSRSEGAGNEAKVPGPSLFPGRDEPRVLEDADMLRNGGKRHRKRPRELSDGLLGASEPREDRAPARVGQSRERCVEAGTVNHMVKYSSARASVSIPCAGPSRYPFAGIWLSSGAYSGPEDGAEGR
jgi:hypothetical protein